MNDAHVTADRPRLIAFYLPQFHPIPENDQWWGKGFTEWTNVAKAKPLFPGHYQPHIPADLGFYDLRHSETRIAQAEMAREYGIEGFCYWHYWFAGKRLLERPFNEVLKSGEPNFPFCLGWANDAWSGIWHGAPNRILMEQTYPGPEDYERHFNALIETFGDDRYITIDGKPLFVVYKPHQIPDVRLFTDSWREFAHRSGLKGLHLVAVSQSGPSMDPARIGFDAITYSNQTKFVDIVEKKRRTFPENMIGPLRDKYREFRSMPVRVYRYEDALPYFLEELGRGILNYPCVVPNWDNSPRSGLRAVILHESTPELFRLQVRKAVQMVSGLPSQNRIIFVKSWNEWAEGNHLEPDLRYGKRYLEVLRDEISIDCQTILGRSHLAGKW